MTTSGRTKLLDFGIARVSRGPLLHKRSGPRALTPAYASYEMLKGEEANPREIHGFPPGLMGLGRLWSDLADRHQVLTLNMIGFGFSDKPYSKLSDADVRWSEIPAPAPPMWQSLSSALDRA